MFHVCDHIEALKTMKRGFSFSFLLARVLFLILIILMAGGRLRELVEESRMLTAALRWATLCRRSFTSGGEDGYVRIHHFDPEYFSFE